MVHSIAATIAVLLLVGGASAQVAPVTLEDFDGDEKLGTNWTALGDIQVSRVDVPEDVRHDGVRGKMVTAQASGNAKFAVKASFPRPTYRTAERLQLRLRADDVSQDKPLVIEFQVFSSQRRAWFWRKITLVESRWKTVELPLRYFRQSPGAVLEWREAHRFAIHFRNAGTLSLDNIQLVPGSGKNPAWMSPQELGKFAFKDKARHFSSVHFAVVTNEPRLDGEAVLAAFEELDRMIKRDLPEMPEPQRRVVCLIFADKARFQTFWRDLGQRFNSVVPVIRSDGYAIFGLAGSSYDDSFGAVRPVYVQEACHALLGQTLGVSNQSEWLHEGLANYYQLHWSGQDIHKLTRGMVEQKRHVPLSKLLNGERINTRDYAQAALFVKWLMTDKQRRSQFWSAIQEMKIRSSTTLAPLTETHFEQSLDELESAWLKWSTNQLTAR